MLVKKAMTPLVALLVFILFLIVIISIVIVWIFSYPEKNLIDCKTAEVSDFSAKLNILEFKIKTGNAKVIGIETITNDLCRDKSQVSIKQNTEYIYSRVVDDSCVPIYDIIIILKLKSGNFEKTCEYKMKNENIS